MLAFGQTSGTIRPLSLGQPVSGCRKSRFWVGGSLTVRVTFSAKPRRSVEGKPTGQKQAVEPGKGGREQQRGQKQGWVEGSQQHGLGPLQGPESSCAYVQVMAHLLTPGEQEKNLATFSILEVPALSLRKWCVGPSRALTLPKVDCLGSAGSLSPR